MQLWRARSVRGMRSNEARVHSARTAVRGAHLGREADLTHGAERHGGMAAWRPRAGWRAWVSCPVPRRGTSDDCDNASGPFSPHFDKYMTCFSLLFFSRDSSFRTSLQVRSVYDDPVRSRKSTLRLHPAGKVDPLNRMGNSEIAASAHSITRPSIAIAD
jgi:hypothetical protein